MAELTTGISWLAVGASTIVCFMLGGLWYSPILFGTKWAKGVRISIEPGAKQPVAALLAQLIGTVLLAWLVALGFAIEAYPATILIVLTAAVLVMAAGLFAEQSNYAVVVQGTFIIVMGMIMAICNMFL